MAMSEANKKAASERLKKYHAEKKLKEQVQEQVVHPDIPEVPTVTEQAGQSKVDDIDELKKQIAELRGLISNSNRGQGGMQNGRMVGRYDKYTIDPLNYENPCAKLKQEPRLKRFAFDINYDLEYSMDTVSYSTQDGVNMREPRFSLQLSRVKLDENGEPTNGRYVITRMVLHEDPDAAMAVARDNGIDVDSMGEVEFLNAMRYLRFRDWLMDIFYPSSPTEGKKAKQEIVVDGKLVEFYEINDVDSQGIPFNELSGKI